MWLGDINCCFVQSGETLEQVPGIECDSGGWVGISVCVCMHMCVHVLGDGPREGKNEAMPLPQILGCTTPL